MNGDFDNLNELFDHNTGRPNNTQQDNETARRNQDLVKYEAFNAEHAPSVDNPQKSVDNIFSQYCDSVSKELIREYGDRSRSIQAAKFRETVDRGRHYVATKVKESGLTLEEYLGIN